MGKAYVVDYKGMPKRKSEGPGFLEWAVDYAERPESATTMIDRETAENQCMNLNSIKFRVPRELYRNQVEPSGGGVRGRSAGARELPPAGGVSPQAVAGN